MEIKTKISKWDLIKLKGFCTAKGSTNKVKRQASEWEKTVAKETTDKELISKICKQLIQLNIKKKNNQIKGLAEDMNRHFSKEDIQIDGQQAHEKMLKITNYQQNANQNQNKIVLHIC